MARPSTQSSRELRAAALESERIQQESEARSQSIEAQIAALRAQQLAAEKDAEKHRTEKEATLQAARNQSFHEACLKAQEAFRVSLADEVYTRVAQVLDGQDAWKNVEEIAHGQTSTENIDELKIILWEAIAGDGEEFLVKAAAKIIDRKEIMISDNDNAEILSSNICLHQSLESNSLQTSVPKAHADVSEIDDSTMTGEIVKFEASNTTSNILPDASSLPITVSDHNVRILQEATQHDDGETGADKGLTKMELSVSHRSMTALEEEEGSTTNAQIGTAQVNREMLSPSTSAMSFDDFDVDRMPCITDVPKPSTPKKRGRKTDSTSPTSGSGSKAIKKPKMTRDGNTAADRVRAFTTHVENAAMNGQLHSTYLECVKCNQPIENDAKVTKCLHLYHSKCMEVLRGLRGDATTKQAAKFKCDREECGQEIGTLNVLKAKAVQDLRQRYAIALHN